MGKAGAKAMTKTALVQAISAETEMKRGLCKKVVENLAGIATEQVKSHGKFTLPGLFRIKTRVKPATKAGKRTASQDCREGVPSCCDQEEHLRWHLQAFVLTCCLWEFSRAVRHDALELCRIDS